MVEPIKITYRNGAYYVNRPNWAGGEVVMAEEYAALKAENEHWRSRAAERCLEAEKWFRKYGEALERALAERAGGVKVKALVELERALCEFINAASDQYDPAAWILETKRNFEALSKAYSDAYSVGVFPDALTTDPAAPEGRQPVAVAWMDDGTLRAGSERTAHRVVTDEQKRDMPNAVRTSFNIPLYTRPAEQAVTEAARAVIEWYERDGSVGGAVEPFEALKAAMEVGR